MREAPFAWRNLIDAPNAATRWSVLLGRAHLLLAFELVENRIASELQAANLNLKFAIR